MKKTKDVSDEDEYSADDPEEVEGASEEDWAPESAEVRPRHFILKLFYPSFMHPFLIMHFI